MKQPELKPCAVCGKGLAHGGQISFYKVKIEQMVIDLGAMRRQAGLEMMVGGLAFHMGPQEDIAKPLQEKEVLLCMTCSGVCIAELMEGE